ncbi:MAG: methionine gamma-lyase family protein [Erysipelotrichaceae bacterium]|nr:methionine gamma-lyase family protein [Erysipelotrichaceae bacterium]
MPHYLELLGIPENLLALAQEVEADIAGRHADIDEAASYNQIKILRAMQEHRLSDMHFAWNTGYGYDDPGRATVEKIFATVFETQSALVRPLIVNGTHALSLCLQGVLRPNDLMLSVTGKPYDTLDKVIGIRGEGRGEGSLQDYGIQYAQVNLLPSGDLDFEAISEKMTALRPRMVYIQRSSGYSWRKSLTVAEIGKLIKHVKGLDPEVIVMVDNCYGEFIDILEPTSVGADLMAGSLIKNPGGGLALSGGYIVGRHDLVEKVSYRMTTPGIGGECGLTFGQNRTILQGLFLAPMVVSGALKGAVFCSRMYEKLGFEVNPKWDATRSDIIQAVRLGTADRVVSFCRGIQSAAPVDAHVVPLPWAMPGYTCEVVMAAGAFVQGSSIELSADAPMREPFDVFFQGGLTFAHSQYGAIRSLMAMGEDKVL